MDEQTFRVRAARRFRWRVAGGHLCLETDRLDFVPNRLERIRPDAAWSCRLEDLVSVTARGRMPWLDVHTATGRQSFRVRRAGRVASRLNALAVPIAL